ncbi:MAG TPA: hypothetical protein V6D08_20195 [Candidatus Obscuribacterales bacterium]
MVKIHRLLAALPAAVITVLAGLSAACAQAAFQQSPGAYTQVPFGSYQAAPPGYAQGYSPAQGYQPNQTALPPPAYAVPQPPYPAAGYSPQPMPASPYAPGQQPYGMTVPTSPVPAQPAYAAPYAQPPYLQGRIVQAPAGLIIPVTLATAISTQVAKAGDYVQATVSQDVLLGNGTIPQGSVVSGQVTDAQAGRLLNRSGALSVTFNQLRLPDGSTAAISGHLVGDLGKYSLNQQGTARGEGWGTKLLGVGMRTAVGAGAGAALGTAMGAITGGSLGTGAWAGTAIGGGGGLLEALILRKGRNVIIPSGTALQFQLDQPANIAETATAPAPMAQPYSGAM